MSQTLDAYRILQVLPDADQDEIKDAFRRLARRYHPDRAPDAESTARMIEVNRAWELVGDPVRRAAYDRANGYLPRATRAAAARSAGNPAGAADATRDPAHGAHATRPGAGVRDRPTAHAGAAGTTATREGAGAAGPRGPVGGGASAPGTSGTAGPSGTAGSSGTSTMPGASGPMDTASGAEVGGYGPAGPPPGRPVGRVLTFGRYSGWSLGEIARVDREYLEWFVRMPVAWQYRDEIRELLESHARTQAEARSAAASADRPFTRRRGILGR